MLLGQFQAAGYENLLLSRITHAELMTLALRKKSGKITVETVRRFSGLLGFADVGAPVWDLFSLIKARLLSTGTPLGDSGNLDILQAGIAITRGLVLVTHNRTHFEAIQKVLPFPLEDWAREA